MTFLLNNFTTIYPSYEERENVFRRSVGFKLARRHAGPATFWYDFSRISQPESTTPDNGDVAYIPSNPRDCLAFSTPRQVLMAALMSAGKAGSVQELEESAHRFEIDHLLSQPIRTLSGGETVKLALAKTFLALDTCSKVIVASPFTWLSEANRHLLDFLLSAAKKTNKKISVMALEGEGDLTPIHQTDPFLVPYPAELPISVDLCDIRIPLTVSLHPLAHQTVHAIVENRSISALSPCLIVGDNGQGKSLLARILAKAITYKGRVDLENPFAKRSPSLLFQDVLTQTMLRSFHSLAGIQGSEKRTRTQDIYRKLQQAYASAVHHASVSGMPMVGDWEEKQHSLLDIKTILVAARLATKPAALIMDEPDWGLSRTSAVAFVSSILSIAHSLKIPVFLISHKPWWHSIARSSIHVSRSKPKKHEHNLLEAFRISLTAEVDAS